MSNCPCDNQDRFECNLCRDKDTLEKGILRMTENKLPREDDKRVKDILNDDTIALSQKAVDIYNYDNACLSREYDRRKPEPKMNVFQITKELIRRFQLQQ